VYACIRFGWSRDHEEAKDLTQALFADLLERHFWEDIDRSRGSFRSFMKAAIRHFMMNVKRDRARLKRGGANAIRSLDEMENVQRPSYAGKTPDEILDQEWICTVLERGIEKLREELTAAGKKAHFEALRRYDIEPSDPPPSYAEVAKELGVRESDIRNYLHEARLRAIVVEAVREYSADADELHQETRFILG
jgi:RNA polymerase sigma-70 factor (ECF subfamily)